ncbi:Glutamate racemase [[Clostridium] ultunense Esp]|nr:Glutamate racemase [[Clostridium] ultunense Esp]
MHPGSIGILDSGVGGLTVVKEVMRQLPMESILYIGDSARCPYGPRPAEEVRRFTYQMIHFLLQFDPKMIVIACNTATSVVLEEAKRWLKIPVIGVIEPGARAAIRESKSGKIGVIGTQGTIKSGMYEKVLTRIKPGLNVVSQACPNLVPLVEDDEVSVDVALQVVQEELSPLIHQGVETLVLGCTHYPIIAPIIQQVMGEEVSLISSAEETASEVSAVLSENHLLATPEKAVHHQFYTTGDPFSFKRIAEKWLERSVEVRAVHLPVLDIKEVIRL